MVVPAFLFFKSNLSIVHLIKKIRCGSHEVAEREDGFLERWLTRCSVRKAGGAIGKRQVAEEERYFRWKEKEQMEVLRKHHTEETEEIYRHEGKIQKVKDDE
uniref:ATPase inhibitor, mitochondrial n=1 Tax=Labrus bergylta TaxID=56723 RepID=A0A3Q3GZ31_9LABR